VSAPAPGPAAVVFDLDGTLVDSAPDICAMANAVLAEAGAAPLTLAEARGFVGAGAGAFVARMRRARDLPQADEPRLLARFLEAYEGPVRHATLYPGVAEALGALAARGHALAVCTNKPRRPADVVLAHFGLAARFGAVVGGDSLPVRKPDPAPLRAAVDALGGGPALFVGDSEIDAETAARAGLPFLLFTEGYRHAPVAEVAHAAAFDHFDRLPALVAELAARPA